MSFNTIRDKDSSEDYIVPKTTTVECERGDDGLSSEVDKKNWDDFKSPHYIYAHSEDNFNACDGDSGGNHSSLLINITISIFIRKP